MMQLKDFELEDLMGKIREQICLANRNGTLVEFLDRTPFADLLPVDPADDFITYHDGMIVVLGDSMVPKGKLIGVAEALGISRDRLELHLEYDLTNYNYKKLQYNADYRVVLVGPMPHSTAGKGVYSSAISAMKNTLGYPKVVELRSEAGKLKITKSCFAEALRGLLDEGYLQAG